MIMNEHGDDDHGGGDDDVDDDDGRSLMVVMFIMMVIVIMMIVMVTSLTLTSRSVHGAHGATPRAIPRPRIGGRPVRST